MVKMRTNSEPDAQCCECGNDRNKSLEMFDICIGGQIITICDLCNEQLFNKTLRAACNVHHKVKQPHDMAIIRKRQAGSYIKKESE